MKNALNNVEGIGQGQLSLISIEAYIGCIFGANLVNLGWVLHESSSGQALFCSNLNGNALNDLGYIQMTC